METLAYAAGNTAGQSMGFFMSIMPLVLIFAVFYFLLIMPQQKKAKEHKQMLESIKKGDDIVTSGGIHGKVVGITDRVITLDVGDKVKIKVSKEFVAYKKTSEDKS
ncbi:MAG: preprotein translocase subunit YajC [Deltaproteobacteria bacterium]|nr:preprotein translocase subunit YajC [Deltaproteobacteria bacterium]